MPITYAVSSYLTTARTRYPAIVGSKLDSCTLCHTQTPTRNSYGLAYANAGRNFATIENLDSDGDGFSNLAEITAKTFPGDRTDFPTTTTTTTSSTTTTLPPSILYFPRMMQNASQWTGFALVNTANQPSQVNFAAFGNDGAPLPAGVNVSNSYSTDLTSGAQFANMAFELFGGGLTTSGSWVRVTGSQPGLAGMFLGFDPAVNTMDGVSVSSRTLQDFILAEPQGAEISLVNTAASLSASVTLKLVDNLGVERATQTLQIPPSGRYGGQVDGLFSSSLIAAGGYLRVGSPVGLVATEFFGIPNIATSALDSYDPTGGGKTVYAPQYAVGGGVWKTILAVINLENAPTSVTLTLNSDTGGVIGLPYNFQWPAGGKAVLTDQSLFGVTPSTSTVTEGYVRIVSTNTRITGYVRFGDPAELQFQSALPFVTVGKTSALFTQLAQNAEYFTGLAIINPNPAAASLSIEAFRSNGTSAGVGTAGIPAGGRQSKVLDQFIANLPLMDKGYFKVTSNQPVFGFAVFGTHLLTVLSAILAQ